MGRRQAVLMAMVCGALLLACGCSKKEESSSAAPASSPAASAPVTAPAGSPAAPASTPAAGSLQSQDANQPGVVGDLSECSREGGVLSIKVRFRNTTSQPVNLQVIDARNYDKFYVTAADKKYFVLKDSEGEHLMAEAGSSGSLTVALAPGQAWTFWAKFPAPPAEVKKVSFMTPITPPYEDVPISDK